MIECGVEVDTKLVLGTVPSSTQFAGDGQGVAKGSVVQIDTFCRTAGAENGEGTDRSRNCIPLSLRR